MALHPVSDYLDLDCTQVPELFDDVSEVWEVIPRIAPWLEEYLEVGNESEVVPMKWDDRTGLMYGQVFIGPKVRIGKGTKISPGAVILGPALIGEDCFIGPGCYLR